MQVNPTSTSAGYKMRFRTSGTDNTSNVYFSAGQFNYAYNGSHFSDSTNPSTISVAVGNIEDNGGSISVMEFLRPQVSGRSFVKGIAAGKFENRHFSICHDADAQFDSASFIMNSGTFSGKVMCYAYNQ